MEENPNFLFAETQTEQDKRLREASKHGHLKMWKMIRIIVKSGDDLR